MKGLLLKAIKLSVIIFPLLGLGGCVSGAIKMMDLGTPEASTPTNQVMSVDELLAQARNGKSSSTESLYIQFDAGRRDMNAKEQQQLIDFASESKQVINLDCGLGKHEDRFTAAAIGIHRCQHISNFLATKTYGSEIQLAPALKKDQVRIYR